jgi:hypothetical protein
MYVGFGSTLACTVRAHGDAVAVTARHPEMLADPVADYPSQTLAIEQDITRSNDPARTVDRCRSTAAVPTFSSTTRDSGWLVQSKRPCGNSNGHCSRQDVFRLIEMTLDRGPNLLTASD